METFDYRRVHVRVNELTERGILHPNFVADNEEFWNWIPLQTETFE